MPVSSAVGYDAPLTIKIFGYCALSKLAISGIVKEGVLDRLRDVPGEYVIVIEGKHETIIVSSPVGTINYFFHFKNGIFYHSNKITDILRKGNLAWSWNWRALGDLCQLENLTGNATLHPDIFKVSPGTILRCANGALDIQSQAYIDTIEPRPSNPDAALEAVNEEVARWAGDRPYLSLSGGFDSRVILSSLLRQGLKPHLITAGSESCSDVCTARKIASAFALEHDLISLERVNILDYARDISEITGGTKPACHWHTYIYPLKANIAKGPAFFVGTLGEFSRSYYFDRGVLGQFANLFDGQPLELFWNLKLRRNWTFSKEEQRGLRPELEASINLDGTIERARRLSALSHGFFLKGLRRFYFEQRVPHFYSNGVSLYLESTSWRSPFHGRGWIDAAWNLDERWRLGSNWHRYAIQSNFPALLDFPEENGFVENRMLAKAPWLYWSPHKRRFPYVSYDMSAEYMRSSEVRDYFMDNVAMLDELIDRNTAIDILEAHRVRPNRARTLGFLLALLCWRQAVDVSQVPLR